MGAIVRDIRPNAAPARVVHVTITLFQRLNISNPIIIFRAYSRQRGRNLTVVPGETSLMITLKFTGIPRASRPLVNDWPRTLSPLAQMFIIL